MQADALLAQERAQRIMLETHLAAEAAALEAERALASSMQRELDEVSCHLVQPVAHLLLAGHFLNTFLPPPPRCARHWHNFTLTRTPQVLHKAPRPQ
jgi:hypothetical protein